MNYRGNESIDTILAKMAKDDSADASLCARMNIQAVTFKTLVPMDGVKVMIDMIAYYNANDFEIVPHDSVDMNAEMFCTSDGSWHLIAQHPEMFLVGIALNWPTRRRRKS
jgi:hypothetical protein